MYNSNSLQVRRILQNATPLQIRLTIQLLFLIRYSCLPNKLANSFLATTYFFVHFFSFFTHSNGDIPITKQSKEEIDKAKKAHFLQKNFGDKNKVLRLLRSEKVQQTEILLKLCTVYRFLLWRCFNSKV